MQLINKEGKETLIKWHWRPTCGLKFLLEDEAAAVVAQCHSHATKDLYDSIASGSFPEWRLYIQTMNPNDEDKYDFDPMDTTKIWPEELFPLQVSIYTGCITSLDYICLRHSSLEVCGKT